MTKGPVEMIGPASPVSLKDSFSLAGRTIIVTGGARGLGLALATSLLEAGGHVKCLDLQPEPAAEDFKAAQVVAAANRVTITYHIVDVTDEAAVVQLIGSLAKEALKTGIPVRGLIHGAAINQMYEAIDYPVDKYRKIFDVNVTGTFIVAKVVANILKEQKTPGSLLLISSMSGYIANRGITTSAYNSTKAAIHQMCRSLSYEWGPYGIRVNTLSPGYIKTLLLDQLLDEKPELDGIWMEGASLNRVSLPTDYIAAAVFLLADGSNWMTGADIRIDGGHCAAS
ncbi:hypothetical protein V1511DRAFT_499113 [Dipodascopsis uninucleata]